MPLNFRLINLYKLSYQTNDIRYIAQAPLNSKIRICLTSWHFRPQRVNILPMKLRYLRINSVIDNWKQMHWNIPPHRKIKIYDALWYYHSRIIHLWFIRPRINVFLGRVACLPHKETMAQVIKAIAIIFHFSFHNFPISFGRHHILRAYKQMFRLRFCPVLTHYGPMI